MDVQTHLEHTAKVPSLVINAIGTIRSMYIKYRDGLFYVQQKEHLEQEQLKNYMGEMNTAHA